ncbi:DNA polymerase II [Candidatus Woesearchaeota archaeon]|nr:DNA polymerase II [Candidatus Woesearchaeota archaeon]
MHGFVVYPTYRIIENKAYVYLFGRLENGESFLTINLFKPYFWIKKTDLNKAQELGKGASKFEVEEPLPCFKNFQGEEVVKIILNIPKEVPELRKLFNENTIVCYEADIRFPYRFMIDKGIKGIMNIEGNFKQGHFVSRIYEEPALTQTEHYEVKLKTLSIDIETKGDASEIYSIAWYVKNELAELSEVLMVSAKEVTSTTKVTVCKDEKTLLETFFERIKTIDPDFITGWNIIDFDLAVIKKQADKYKIPFILGRAEWASTIKIYDDFFKSSDADVAGRQVLDGIELLKGAFIKLNDYKLDTAAGEILGRKKTEQFINKRLEIETMYQHDKERLAVYNQEDTRLVIEILEKKNLLNLTIQRSLLTGMQPDRVSSSIASLDNLYLRETMKRLLVCPTASFSDREERIKGGFVRDPDPGIYEFIIVLDFKSLYPSIIRTFNIDPYSFDKNGTILAPNGARFRNENGILPMIIERLWRMRDEAKKRKDDVASYAIKITMNSFFGCLANPHCRFYSIELGNAITHFGQQIVKETADRVEEMGYKVVYGDTDSIFVLSKADNYQEAETIALKIQDFINEYFEGKVKDLYDRPSFLELEFDKVFKKFILPKIRGSELGAKKRYAGLVLEEDGKEEMTFTGLEFVRRDWTDLAKEFQMEILKRIFKNEEIQEYVKQFVKEVKEGKHDKLLIYRKAIRKDVKEYTKTTPPHVKAARLLGTELESTIIEYVITTEGPEPIQKQKNKIDYDHYIEKQLKPIADSVLVFFDTNFDELTTKKKQKTLFNY